MSESWEIEFYGKKLPRYTNLVAVLHDVKNGVTPSISADDLDALITDAEWNVEHSHNQINEARQKDLEKAWKASPEYPMAFDAWKAKQELLKETA